MSARRQIAPAAAALVALLAGALAGCGLDTKDAGKPRTLSPAERAAAAKRQTTPVAKLPQRPRGVVAVDGLARGDSLTVAAAEKLAARSNVIVTFASTTEPRSLADLCAGKVDFIETNAVPQSKDLAACRRHGLELVEAIQVGSDAIVLATKNEADLGGDCITVAQARDIFRAGSPIQSWGQLGFDDLPLRATGRQQSSENFQFFAFEVLGLPNASLADVRSDYVARRSDRAEREDVTNIARIASAHARARGHLAALRQRTIAERLVLLGRAERAADRRVLRRIDRENRRRTRLQTGFPPDLTLRNMRRVERAKALARAKANRRFEARLLLRARRFERDALALADAPGTVGPFRFSYYELFEEKLRPLEIDFGVPETESGQPVTVDDLPAAAQRRLRDRRPGQPVRADENGKLPASKDADGNPIYPGPGCVFPSQLTVTSGVYPLTRRIFVVTSRQALKRREVREFLTAFLENTRELAVSQRLVPITDQQRVEGLALVTGKSVEDQIKEQGGSVETTTTTSTTQQGTSTTTTPQGTATTPSSSEIPGVSSRG